MEEKTFKVGTETDLILGYTGETNATSITFEDFTLSDENNTMYLIIDTPIDKMIQLDAEYKFVVTSAVTASNYRTTGQLAEVAPDGTMVRKSATFSVTVNKGLAVNMSNILA